MARPRAWGTTLINVEYLNTGDMSIQTLLAQLEPSDTITVVRLLIDLRLVPTALGSTLTGGAMVDLGIGVASEVAFDAGATALPDPAVAADVPARGWLWRSRMYCSISGSAAADSARLWAHVDVLRADVRAARRVDRGILFLRTEATLVDDTFPDCRSLGIIRALCLT